MGILEEQGRATFEKNKVWGPKNFHTPGQNAVLLSGLFSSDIRKEYGLKPDKSLGPNYEIHNQLNRYFNELLDAGVITEETLKKWKLKGGHMGPVGIPGWMYAMNDPRNIVSMQTYIDDALSNNQTMDEFLATNRHIGRGSQFALAGENREIYEKLVRANKAGKFPATAAAILTGPVGVRKSEPYSPSPHRIDFVRAMPKKGNPGTGDPAKMAEAEQRFYIDRRGNYGPGVLTLPETLVMDLNAVAAENFDHRAQLLSLGRTDADVSALENVPKDLQEEYYSNLENEVKQNPDSSALDQSKSAFNKLDKSGRIRIASSRAGMLAVGMLGASAVFASDEDPNDASTWGDATTEKFLAAMDTVYQWEQNGMQAIQQGIPGAKQVGELYNAGIDWLNWGKGQETSSDVYYDESGQPTGGGTWKAERGGGDIIDFIRQWVVPVEDVATGIGALGSLQPNYSEPSWTEQDNLDVGA